MSIYILLLYIYYSTTPLWARSIVNVKSSDIEQKSVLSSVDPSKVVPIQPKKLTVFNNILIL